MGEESYRVDIDLGSVRDHGQAEPFQFHLDANALKELMSDARQGHRIYELMLISRPGDIWDYVRVELEQVPERIRQMAEWARQDLPVITPNQSWPDLTLPFNVLDAQFEWSWDIDPAEETWLNFRDSKRFKQIATLWYQAVVRAQELMDREDPVINHVLAMIRERRHPYDIRPRTRAVDLEMSNPPHDAALPETFHRRLALLLTNPDIQAVAYRGEGDYRILRAFAATQLSRGELSGQPARKAFPVHVLVNHKVSNEAWGSQIAYFEEGLGMAFGRWDLYIQDRWPDSMTVKSLVENDLVRCRFILVLNFDGDIEGYTRDTVEGWSLYHKNRR